MCDKERVIVGRSKGKQSGQGEDTVRRNRETQSGKGKGRRWEKERDRPGEKEMDMTAGGEAHRYIITKLYIRSIRFLGVGIHIQNRLY